MVKGRKYNYLLVAAFIVFGIAIAMQFKSTLISSRQEASSALNAENLKKQIVEAQKEQEGLKKAIDENLASKEKIIKEHLAQQSNADQEAEWNEIRLVAGISDVKGAGIVLKLDDAPARDKDTPVSWQIIHDGDIREILNILKVAGAEAISVNGERITAISEQVCAGPTILINGNRYPVPFVIKAIGNQDDLYAALNNSEIIAVMKEMKIRVDLSKNTEVQIPKYSNSDSISRFISGLEADD